MVRKPLVTLVVAFAIIIFFGLANAEPTDLLASRQDSTFTVEPLGEDFAPAPGLAPCGPHFLITTVTKDTSDPPAIVIFLNRIKAIRFEYDQRLLVDNIHFIVDHKRFSPQARLHYGAGPVTADLWLPVNELDNCPCLKALVKVPFR